MIKKEKEEDFRVQENFWKNRKNPERNGKGGGGKAFLLCPLARANIEGTPHPFQNFPLFGN